MSHPPKRESKDAKKKILSSKILMWSSAECQSSKFLGNYLGAAETKSRDFA